MCSQSYKNKKRCRLKISTFNDDRERLSVTRVIGGNFFLFFFFFFFFFFFAAAAAAAADSLLT